MTEETDQNDFVSDLVVSMSELYSDHVLLLHEDSLYYHAVTVQSQVIPIILFDRSSAKNAQLD